MSYSNDDSFEWFGGTVNCKYLIAFKGWDDDFDTDNGFSGKVRYGLVVRDPRLADTSQSNGFESDNNADGTAVSPYTSAVFSNITFVGPNGREGFSNDDSYINGGSYYSNNGSALGKFQAAMQIRRSSHLACFNSVAIGFPIGLIIDGEKGNTVEYAKSGNLKFQHIYFAGMDAVGTDGNKVYEDIPVEDYGHSFSHEYFENQKGNKVYENMNDLKFKDGRNIGIAYMPITESPVLNAAAWTDDLLVNGFDKVNYIGAFDTSDDWLEGWTNFDPNNADYE